MARPENEPETPLARRLRDVRRHFGVENREAFAGTVGVSKDALAMYERGKNVPTATVLAAYRERYGVSMDWLITGAGEMFADPSKARTTRIDAELMERLHDRVASIFHELGQKPPARRIAREATNLYNELAKAVPDLTDTEMIDVTLPRLALDFKRRISEAVAEPGTGKRSAS